MVAIFFVIFFVIFLVSCCPMKVARLSCSSISNSVTKYCWTGTRNAINWKRQPNYDISCLIVSLDLFESENNFTFGDDKQAAIIFLVHSEQQVELGWGALGAGRV